ncbi:restriction endonuclease subunit S [Anaerostipes hadrus]|jgi:type I restriction enzyme S subunit|uniref:restriction endonuclease subunit S n=1 Tax=Anaerostipes hadrus TaxID=649756 RepID=UPI0022E7E277|nr:restriction endonuclease subunit S [Anaerostipes hadrus]
MARVKLEDVCERGSSNLKQSDVVDKDGDYPIYGASGYIGNVDFYHQEQPYVAVVKDGAGIGRTTLHPAKSSVIGTMQYLLPKGNVLPEYLCYVVKYMHLEKYFTGATIPHIYFKDYKNEEFNLDSLDRQKEIVSTLNKIEKVIESRTKELELLDELIRARFVEMFGNPDVNEKNWNVYKMEQLCEVGSSKRIYQNDQSLTGIPFLRISDLVNRMDTGSKDCDLFIPEELFEKFKKQGLVPARGDILLTARGTLGRCYIIQDDDEFYFQDGMITWLSKFDEKITPLYISYLFEMPEFRKQIDSLQAGSTVAYLSISMTKELNVMVPPLELQNQFAAFVAQTDKSKFDIHKFLYCTSNNTQSIIKPRPNTKESGKTRGGKLYADEF